MCAGGVEFLSEARARGIVARTFSVCSGIPVHWKHAFNRITRVLSHRRNIVAHHIDRKELHYCCIKSISLHLSLSYTCSMLTRLMLRYTI